MMPIKELKDFECISLKRRGSRKVAIRLKKDLFCYWDEEKGHFIYLSGNYTIMIGTSSANIRLQKVSSIT